MQAAQVRRAVAAAISTASGLGLAVDDAVVLSDSNRLVLRLMPCDVIARVSAITHLASPEREVELAQRLAATDSAVAALDPRVEPRVYRCDGFVIAFWTYFEPAETSELPPADYVHALVRMHAAMRQIDVTTPHFTERVADTQRWVASRDVTPDLTDADRALLADTLANLKRSIVDRGAAEQVLHGEPHPWNVLSTKDELLFIDLENTVRGPVEFDLAWVPQAVSERYPDADQELVGECRGLVVALIAAARWRRDDQHPSGRRSGVEFLDHLREGPPWLWLDAP